MAGAMRKMAVYLGLVEDERYDERFNDEYDEGYEDFADDTQVAEPAAARSGVLETAGARSAGAVGVTPQRPVERQPITTDLARITTLHPRTYNEARTIGEHFREGTPVIMNLTEMSDSDAKRLVDFAAGLIFGLHGDIERVTNKVFLLSPVNVEVTAEDKARIAERGFFNQS